MSRELFGGKSDFPPEEIEHRDAVTRDAHKAANSARNLQNGRNVATTSSLEFKINILS